MKYAFIGGILTPSIKEKIEKTSKGVIQYAADALQKCYIEGLVENNIDFMIFNLPYVGGFPNLSTIYKFTGLSEKLHFQNRIINCHNVAFTNLKGYKNWSRYKSLKRALKSWVKENEGNEICLIVYAVHTPFMKACVEIKRKFPTISLVLIVPDLPTYMGTSNKGLRGFFSHQNTKIAKKLYKDFDGYVFLSEYMKEHIPTKSDNYVVVEGIYSDDLSVENESHVADNTKKIVYTGTLAERYGIMNLVKAFTLIPDSNMRLVIIGRGEAVPKIKEAAQKELRIIYLGQLPREEVLQIQRQSSLLVNPRTSEGEFTKYSFPSKTMEYLASGIPTILNKLPGIPDEYYEYSFQPDNESVDALRKKMVEILKLPDDEQKDFGSKAKAFILTEKNPRSQVKKLIELTERVINHTQINR